jgi:hypothetical protein
MHARDPRIAVRIEDPAITEPVIVYFVRYVDTAVEASALVNIGIEVGRQFEATPGEPLEVDRMPRPIDRFAVEHVAARFREYVEYARLSVNFGSKPPPNAPKRRRQLTDDFLSLIAEQFQRWSAGRGRAVTEIANAHNVDRATASRWVKAARERGLLEPKQGDDA